VLQLFAAMTYIRGGSSLKPRWSLQVAAYLRDFPEICSMPRPFLCHAGIFMGPGCNSLVVQKQLDGVVEWSMQIPGSAFPQHVQLFSRAPTWLQSLLP
jgi:hypothetical protein